MEDKNIGKVITQLYSFMLLAKTTTDSERVYSKEDRVEFFSKHCDSTKICVNIKTGKGTCLGNSESFAFAQR